MSADLVCPVWVGLEVPMTVSCYLPAGHEGDHEAVYDYGSVRVGDSYESVPVKMTWPVLIDGSGGEE